MIKVLITHAIIVLLDRAFSASPFLLSPIYCRPTRSKAAAVANKIVSCQNKILVAAAAAVLRVGLHSGLDRGKQREKSRENTIHLLSD